MLKMDNSDMANPSTLLVVDNLSVSKDFYIKLLGLNIIEEHDDAIKLKIAEHHVFMFQGSMSSVEYQHGYNANSTLVFTLDNLDEKIAELKSNGVCFVHESPNQNRWGRYAAFKDPSRVLFMNSWSLLANWLPRQENHTIPAA